MSTLNKLFTTACMVFVALCTYHLVVKAMPNKTLQNVNNKAPSVNEIFENHVDSDVFQWQNALYLADVDWVERLHLQPEQKLGTIEENAALLQISKNHTATHLPIGTEIYSTKHRNDILLAKIDNNFKAYLILVEG